MPSYELPSAYLQRAESRIRAHKSKLGTMKNKLGVIDGVHHDSFAVPPVLVVRAGENCFGCGKCIPAVEWATRQR
jgi:dissimilatory sulfite reductase (desulfoviridin) alpha/beta subunit